jgi:hypothetical protein
MFALFHQLKMTGAELLGLVVGEVALAIGVLEVGLVLVLVLEPPLLHAAAAVAAATARATVASVRLLRMVSPERFDAMHFRKFR